MSRVSKAWFNPFDYITSHPQTKIAVDAPAARRYLARHNALDLADMLGIGGAA